MPFEFIQIPATGHGAAKEALNALLRGGGIASVWKEFVANAEDSFWASFPSFLPGPQPSPSAPAGAASKALDALIFRCPPPFLVSLLATLLLPLPTSPRP